MPDPAVMQQHPREERLARWPIIGGQLAWLVQAARIRRGMSQVREALRRREAFPSAAWESAGFPSELAEAVAKAIAQRVAYLPNHHFLPDDPLGLLLLDTDGMGVCELDYVMNTRFGVELKTLPVREMAAFGHLVQYLHRSAAA